MPSGVPVASVGVNAAANAALLAMRILALSDEELATKYRNYVKQQEENVRQQDRDVSEATRLYE
jgi:5-(carboxyamino)imidazole ribonucleotide mutase